ncbi:hypothetical protein LC612_30290, partial [Nostoc sp. CHAB 5834]|nr:hypothetical protein [Nostoc sp. CHAB 5834]
MNGKSNQILGVIILFISILAFFYPPPYQIPDDALMFGLLKLFILVYTIFYVHLFFLKYDSKIRWILPGIVFVLCLLGIIYIDTQPYFCSAKLFQEGKEINLILRGNELNEKFNKYNTKQCDTIVALAHFDPRKAWADINRSRFIVGAKYLLHFEAVSIVTSIILIMFDLIMNIDNFYIKSNKRLEKGNTNSTESQTINDRLNEDITKNHEQSVLFVGQNQHTDNNKQ